MLNSLVVNAMQEKGHQYQSRLVYPEWDGKRLDLFVQKSCYSAMLQLCEALMAKYNYMNYFKLEEVCQDQVMELVQPKQRLYFSRVSPWHQSTTMDTLSRTFLHRHKWELDMRALQPIFNR